MTDLLASLKKDHASLTFNENVTFSWSPAKKTITYSLKNNETLTNWSLLHEVAHALLGHKNYETDFELLLLEVAAWQKAKELANNYAIQIDEDHIQDCLDTYRDWLYQRSSCPTCSNTSLQQDATTYACFNCGASWTVTASRFCRPYRLSAKQKTPSEALTGKQTTFL